jgi:hypothetical protein
VQQGKLVTLYLDCTVTAANGGTGALLVSLPVTAKANFCGTVSGRETGSTGLVAYGTVGTTNGLYIQVGASANPNVNAYQIVVSGQYEAA